MKTTSLIPPQAGDLPSLDTLEAATNAALELLNALRKVTGIIPLPVVVEWTGDPSYSPEKTSEKLNSPATLLHAIGDYQNRIERVEQCAAELQQKLWAMNLAELTGGSVIPCGSRCANTWHELPLTLYETMREHNPMAKALCGPYPWHAVAGDTLQRILNGWISNYLDNGYARLCEASAFFDLDKAQDTQARIAAKIRNEQAAARWALREWGAKVSAGEEQLQAAQETTADTSLASKLGVKTWADLKVTFHADPQRMTLTGRHSGVFKTISLVNKVLTEEQWALLEQCAIRGGKYDWSKQFIRRAYSKMTTPEHDDKTADYEHDDMEPEVNIQDESCREAWAKSQNRKRTMVAEINRRLFRLFPEWEKKNKGNPLVNDGNNCTVLKFKARVAE